MRLRDEAQVVCVESEKKAVVMVKRVEIAKEKNSRLEGDLAKSRNDLREMSLKYEALLKLRDHDLKNLFILRKKEYETPEEVRIDPPSEDVPVSIGDDEEVIGEASSQRNLS
ncbi:unnamed protein product [Cochlearia groenlandica]